VVLTQTINTVILCGKLVKSIGCIKSALMMHLSPGYDLTPALQIITQTAREAYLTPIELLCQRGEPLRRLSGPVRKVGHGHNRSMLDIHTIYASASSALLIQGTHNAELIKTFAGHESTLKRYLKLRT